MADVLNALLTTQKSNLDCWYKEPWMLLVIGGPILVVVACLVTGFLAYSGADKVLSGDYYKQGLLINRDINLDAAARKYAMQASLGLDSGTGVIALEIEGNTVLADQVVFQVATSAGSLTNEVSSQIVMKKIRPGRYEGKIRMALRPEVSNPALWHVKVEGPDWRLLADWRDPAHSRLQLRPAAH